MMMVWWCGDGGSEDDTKNVGESDCDGCGCHDKDIEVVMRMVMMGVILASELKLCFVAVCITRSLKAVDKRTKIEAVLEES